MKELEVSRRILLKWIINKSDSVDWLQEAQYNTHWRASVNVYELSGSINDSEFLDSLGDQ